MEGESRYELQNTMDQTRDSEYGDIPGGKKKPHYPLLPRGSHKGPVKKDEGPAAPGEEDFFVHRYGGKKKMGKKGVIPEGAGIWKKTQ